MSGSHHSLVFIEELKVGRDGVVTHTVVLYLIAA